jgi:hypothetical protein
VFIASGTEPGGFNVWRSFPEYVYRLHHTMAGHPTFSGNGARIGQQLPKVMVRTEGATELSDQRAIMRTLLTLLSFLSFFLVVPALGQDEPPGADVDAFVTFRVEGMTADDWTRIAGRVSKEQTMNVEYSCTRTCVIVLRIQPAQIADKADIIALVKRIVREAGVKGSIDFLDIHVEPHGGDKC